MKCVPQHVSTMELPVLLLADYANVTRTGKLNVMGVFDRIGATGFPIRHSEMVLVMKFTAGPAEYEAQRKIRVQLLDADAENAIVDWSIDVQVPKDEAGRGRVEISQFLTLRDLIFPKAGTYRFYVTVDNDEKGSIPLYVEQQDAE